MTTKRIYEIIDECINQFVINESWRKVSGTPMKEREKSPEKIISKVYKQVRIKNNDLTTAYPLFVDSNFSWKIGKWYDAGIGDYEIEIDDISGKPTGKVKVKSKLGGLSFRPGLHFGTLPYAPHIYKKGSNYDEEDIDGNSESNPYGKMDRQERNKIRRNFDFSKTRKMQDDYVWAECDIIFDKDYQEEADKNGMYNRSNGEIALNHRNAYLKKIPINGTYKYKTNSSASDEQTWYISGSFKINRILSDDEVSSICSEEVK